RAAMVTVFTSTLGVFLSLTPNKLIPPYGGALIDLTITAGALEELREQAGRLPSLQLTSRSICDLELLATGAFSPLDRFMGQADYERVVAEMRLASGHIFPIPVTLPVDPAPGIELGADIALRDSENNILAAMTIEEMYDWDLTTA